MRVRSVKALTFPNVKWISMLERSHCSDRGSTASLRLADYILKLFEAEVESVAVSKPKEPIAAGIPAWAERSAAPGNRTMGAK